MDPKATVPETGVPRAEAGKTDEPPRYTMLLV